MSSEHLGGAVALAHHFLRSRLQEGDRAIDATCGNGHDTLALARLVGESGLVWGFDVQPAALETTASRLAEAGCRDRVELVAAGHERLAELVTEPVRAVVFNLGYLPGSDKTRITRPETTVAALEQATSLLLPGGIIVVAVYTGHSGGGSEGEAVEQWASARSPHAYNAWVSRQINRPPTAPWLLVVEKTGTSPQGAP